MNAFNRIGAYSSAGYATGIQLYDNEWGFDGFNVTPSGFRTAALAAQALVNGNIQYVIVDSAPASAIVKKINALN